jgi:mono/diheme cytochrome c family protein
MPRWFPVALLMAIAGVALIAVAGAPADGRGAGGPAYDPMDPATPRALYARCQACHGVDGRGLGGLGPPLAGNPRVEGDEAHAVRMILHGGPGTGWRMAMRGYAPDFSDHEVALVATFIRTQWGNQGATVSAAAVRRIRSAP